MKKKPVTLARGRTRFIDTTLLLAMICLGGSGSWYLYESLETTLKLQRNERLTAAGQAVTDSLDLDLNRAIETVHSAGLMVATQEQLRREEFTNYASRVMSSARNFRFLEWQPVVPAKNLAAFEAAARRNGLPNFRVTELINGHLVPVRPREEYVPVLYAWPENTGALGVDMGFDAGRMASKYMARDTGRPVASEAFKLISSGKQADFADAFAISTPVYRDATTLTIAQRRKSLLGYVAGVIQIPELMREASYRARSAEVDMLVFDRSSEPRKLIFSAIGEQGDWANASDLASRETDPSDRILNVQVGARAWEIVLHPQPAFLNKTGHTQSVIAFWSGMLATLALTLMVYCLQRNRSALERVQASMLLAESELLDERQHLANVLDGTNAGTWEWNIQTGEVQLNDRWLSMLGYTTADCSPINIQTWRDLMHPDDLVRASQRLNEHFSGEQEFYRCEFRMRHKAQHWVWIAAHGRLLSRTEQGLPEWIAGTHIEISEQKRVTQSLLDVKAALDAHAIVAISDRAGKITHANDKFCEISEYSRDELLGQDHRIINSGYHPKAFFVGMWRTIARGRTWRGQICNRARSGRLYWVDTTIAPIIGADGKPEQYIAIRYDITEAKLHEERLLEAKNLAEQATMAKGQFLANMSHEIRTPMNAILGMLRLLLNTDLSSKQLDYAQKSEGAAKSLLSLLNDILDFSKVEAGKMSLDLQPFRLDRVCRDISVILSAYADGKPIDVLFDIDPKLSQTLVGDAMRLQQVLINLASNAIKFTPTGEVVIKIESLLQDATECTLQFSVRDTGIGIAPEHQVHIFEGFTQAEASTTRRFGGTGLGLSISKQLVSLMGGDLALESRLGRGSTFYFTVKFAAEPAPQQERSSRKLGSLAVLIVDDNATARKLMVDMARSWGWFADTARNGAEAIMQVKTRQDAGLAPYKVIFLDWQMPDLDGWQTLAEMRVKDAKDEKPIIVMVSSHGRESLLQRSVAEQAALHAFLVKPISACMLFDAVADALEGRKNIRTAPREKLIKQKPLKDLRLLIVEDNKINQQIAVELLTAEGATVELVENGQLGVKALAKKPAGYDIVLMDLQMPVMDGFEATRAIRQDLKLSDLPIIAMTANVMASDREACLAAGMNGHIGKPLNLENLIAVILKQTRGAHTELTSLPGLSAKGANGELPPIDTLDVASAIGRFGGDRALYANVLQAYLDELAIQPEQFDALVKASDFVGAARLLHTLKGLSGTVGAVYMRAFSEAAETALKQATDASQCEAWRTNLRTAVAETSRVMQSVAR